MLRPPTTKALAKILSTDVLSAEQATRVGKGHLLDLDHIPLSDRYRPAGPPTEAANTNTTTTRTPAIARTSNALDFTFLSRITILHRWKCAQHLSGLRTSPESPNHAGTVAPFFCPSFRHAVNVRSVWLKLT